MPKRSKTKAIAIIEPGRGEVPDRAHGRLDEVYGAYLDQLDPRGSEIVQQALAATEDPRFKEFLERINMPKYSRVSLQTIAKACCIPMAVMQAWWQKASVQRAVAVAQTQSVIITQHMAEDAKSVDDECPRCEGLGFVAAAPGLPNTVPGYKLISKATKDQPERWIRDCPKCKGATTVRTPGDSHSRDKLLDMAGLVKKGPAVNITQNFCGASQGSAVRDMDDLNTIDI